MPIYHNNCYDEVYVLNEGKTTTGKPRYYFSKKTNGQLPETIPEGYEIYERPGGMVYLRKIKISPIFEEELKYVQGKISFLCDQESEKSLSDLRKVFEANIPSLIYPKSQAILSHLQTRFEAEIRDNEIVIYRVQHSNAQPIMKFELIDKDVREFSAYRWCFRGSIDDWVTIGFSGKLKKLVDQYCQALGTDDFYELY
jgi:hypothetical protein